MSDIDTQFEFSDTVRPHLALHCDNAIEFPLITVVPFDDSFLNAERYSTPVKR